jgi:RNA polymerase sigma-70 factor (ECF subfamily)
METMEQSDRELVQAAQTGDRRALEALLDRHQRAVWRFGMKLCANTDDAQDVLQETLLAAARNLPAFRGESAVSTWLYTIARSFCLKKRRQSKFAPEAIESLDGPVSEARAVPDQERGPEEQVAGKQVGAVLEEAIDALAPAYREVLLLRDVEGLSAPETASVLGLSVEAVKSRLHRARMSVRERVAPALGILVGPPQPGCPDVLPLLSRHLEGELRREDCAEMERHVGGCPRCTAACDSLRQVLAVCRASPAPAVPAHVQASVREAVARLLQNRRPGDRSL